MEEPLVAIIVVSWNRKDDTVRCLESVFDTVYQNKLVILVDNASNDGTIESARKRFPDLEVISNSRNIGYGPAANKGMQLALSRNAKYIMPLNNDLIVSQDFITNAVKIGQNEKSVGALVPVIRWMDEPDRIYAAGARTDLLFLIQLRRQSASYLEEAIKDGLKEVDASGLFMLTREAILKCGTFDEDFYLYLEDFEYCMRIRESGFRLLLVPGMRVWHKGSASMGGPSSATLTYYNTRNRFLLWRRRYRWPATVAIGGLYLLVAVPLRMLFYCISVRRRENTVAYLTGLRDGIRYLLSQGLNRGRREPHHR